MSSFMLSKVSNPYRHFKNDNLCSASSSIALVSNPYRHFKNQGGYIKWDDWQLSFKPL
ncbi:MAG: hypothetical protein N3F08_06915 [Crenarchaeota archaeon]|nr:hypothetical protein [Thermoproteota archaeon]